MIRTMTWRLLALMAIVLLRGGNIVVAEEVGAEKPSSHTAAEIEAKLAEMTSFRFQEVEIVDVAEAIGERHGMRVVVDRRELDDEGLGTDLPITIAIEGVQLDAALELMLKPFDLTYVVGDGYLMVTTEVEAEGMLETRVYSVGDLLDHVGAGATMDGLIQGHPGDDHAHELGHRRRGRHRSGVGTVAHRLADAATASRA